jgi:hypothetical protein
MGFGAGLALPRSLTSASRKTGSVSLEPSAWSTLESEIGSLRGFAEIPIRYRSLSIHVADEPPETELDYETAHHLREVDYHRISVDKVFQVYGTDPDLGLDIRAVERANDANKTKRANVITPAKTNYLKKFARYIFGKPMHACDFGDPRLPAGFDLALFRWLQLPHVDCVHLDDPVVPAPWSTGPASLQSRCRHVDHGGHRAFLVFLQVSARNHHASDQTFLSNPYALCAFTSRCGVA